MHILICLSLYQGAGDRDFTDRRQGGKQEKLIVNRTCFPPVNHHPSLDFCFYDKTRTRIQFSSSMTPKSPCVKGWVSSLQ
jgi:hypothetical protein